MFLAIVFIVLGLFLLLNAMGIVVSAHFWAFFWAIVFLAIGVRMLMRRESCPMCSGMWYSKKFHQKMHDHCDCGHEHEHHEGEDEEEQN